MFARKRRLLALLGMTHFFGEEVEGGEEKKE
jgi:hypothetical protein